MSHQLVKRFFPKDQHHSEGLYGILMQTIPATGRVLDLGCGVNNILVNFRTEQSEVWGADFQVHSELCHPEWFRQLAPDGSIPFPDEYFDVIVTVMVMEHIANPAVFLKEVARVLRPGGHFVGHTISGSHYVTWIRRMLDIMPHSFNQWLVKKLYNRAEEDTFPTHYRLNRDSQIKRACRETGFGDPEITRYVHPGYFAFFKPLLGIAIISDWLLEKVKAGWGRLYFTVVTRKEDNEPVTECDTTREKAA